MIYATIDATLNKEKESKLHTIEEAIADIKAGKVIIVVDDEDRENEGDFVCAAECITPEIINFMATQGRGLICTPITKGRAQELRLTPMVDHNSDLHGTAFTISIDYKKKGCTTGISAYDRSTGIQAILNSETKPEDFARPGHIFPLIAKDGGVLKRTGHTEAAIDLATMAGFQAAGVLVEILNEDGTMARLPQLLEIAKKLDLKIISIKDLVSYRMAKERLVSRELSFEMETKHGLFQIIAFSEKNNPNLTHLALKKGDWTADDVVLTRVHSSSYAGDILNSLRIGKQKELSHILGKIEAEGKGLLLYLMNDQADSGILDALKTIKEQMENDQDIRPFPNITQSTVQRNLGIGAQILNDLNVRKIRLLTNNVKRRVALSGYDIEIVENVNL